jgi:hypothetical protein
MKTMNIKHTAKSIALKTTTDICGSGDSPLFAGLPKGNATWF